MANATLKFNGREIRLGEDLTTIGRASDNTVSFEDNANLSRYHVEIENRGGGFYLIELGSVNGTAINGIKFSGEKLLNDGDILTLGDSAILEFVLDKDPEQKAETPVENADETANETAPNESSVGEDETGEKKFPMGLAVAGASVGLALVFAAGAVLFSMNPTASGCQARAKITNVENYDTLREAKEIEVELEDDQECVSRAVFLLNDKILATADEKPFTAKLDPNNFPALATGENVSLKVILEDADGKRIQQSDEISLVLETRAVETPKPIETQTPEPTGGTPTPKPTPAKKGKITPAEAQTMVENLIKQMGGSGYKINKEFIEKVIAKTNDFATVGGYSARAQGFQDVIKTEFAKNTDVGAPLGFLTAMNRTQFNPAQGAEVGLWKMSNDFATQNSLTTACGSESLTEINCSAKASAIYTKNLLRTVFDNDPVYTVAAYGMPLGDAYNWKLTLTGDRADFWNAIKTPAQRDELVKFFAAAIVAENPQNFGLKDDKPISALY
jgi:pSer/pThr/pTyr-binding forkhead associated (FHA) protein